MRFTCSTAENTSFTGLALLIIQWDSKLTQIATPERDATPNYYGDAHYDAVLADMGAVFADEYAALGAKSAALCYRYASGTSVEENFTGDLPAPLVKRESEIYLRVVETAKKRQDVPTAVTKDLWKKFGTQLATRGVGDNQLKLLTGGSVPASRFSEYCRTSETVYREISRLPPKEAAIIMRSMLADK